MKSMSLFKTLILGFFLLTASWMQAQQTRTEKDLLGEKQIPAEA